MTDIKYIRTNVPYNALLSQLGEELAELAQALFKLRRAEGNGNPTPVTVEEARAAVQEEISDVVNCCKVLNITIFESDEEPSEKNFMQLIDCIGSSLICLATGRECYAEDTVLTALMNCALLGYSIDFDPENPKLHRWRERLEAAEHE